MNIMYYPPYGRDFHNETVASREQVGQATTTAFAPAGIWTSKTAAHPLHVTLRDVGSGCTRGEEISGTCFEEVITPSGSETPPLLTTV